MSLLSVTKRNRSTLGPTGGKHAVGTTGTLVPGLLNQFGRWYCSEYCCVVICQPASSNVCLKVNLENQGELEHFKRIMFIDI
jgi:hypothetical protein